MTIMKHVYFAFMFIAFMAVMTSCNQSRTKNAGKTIENLKAAITGETTASAKYGAFAEKAKLEGFEPISRLFLAASKAESIHAANHLKVLEEFNVKMDSIKPEFEVKTTVENLKSAIEGETHEATVMYPEFIKIAEKEGVTKAVTSFTWALDTEKKHRDFYTAALDKLNKNDVRSIAVNYFVCPKCGNTFESTATPGKCDFCMTPKDKFIKI